MGGQESTRKGEGDLPEWVGASRKAPHGSSGEADSASDVDLLVTFDVPPTLLELISLELKLSEVLGRKVDLVMKSALKPQIGQVILEEAEEIVCDEASEN